MPCITRLSQPPAAAAQRSHRGLSTAFGSLHSERSSRWRPSVSGDIGSHANDSLSRAGRVGLASKRFHRLRERRRRHAIVTTTHPSSASDVLRSFRVQAERGALWWDEGNWQRKRGERLLRCFQGMVRVVAKDVITAQSLPDI